jgi:hypothetical protein
MARIPDKRERITKAIKHFLNFLFFPFPVGDFVFNISGYIKYKIKKFFGFGDRV